LVGAIKKNKSKQIYFISSILYVALLMAKPFDNGKMVVKLINKVGDCGKKW